MDGGALTGCGDKGVGAAGENRNELVQELPPSPSGESQFEQQLQRFLDCQSAKLLGSS